MNKKKTEESKVGIDTPNVYVPTQDWYILTANSKTKEVLFYGCNNKKVIEKLKENHNRAIDLVSKGPYLFMSRETELRAPSYEEFLALD